MVFNLTLSELFTARKWQLILFFCPGDTGNAEASYKLAADLNVEAKESDEEEDDIDWEDG